MCKCQSTEMIIYTYEDDLCHIFQTKYMNAHIFLLHCESAKGGECVCQRKSLFFLIHSSTLALS